MINAPLRIRTSDYLTIRKVTSTCCFTINPEELFVIENDDDFTVLIIPMDRVDFSKKDFSREYRLDFYQNGFRCDVAYLSRINKEIVGSNNQFSGYNDADVFQSNRPYFYDINGDYYAIELHGRYLSMSDNQSKALADVLKRHSFS